MANKMKKGAREITLTGFVEEFELEDGEMGLQLDDGDDVYLIVMDDIGDKLHRYVDEEIDVTGILTKTGNKHELKVNSFRLTDTFEDDDDDRYDDEDYEDDDSYYDENED